MSVLHVTVKRVHVFWRRSAAPYSRNSFVSLSLTGFTWMSEDTHNVQFVGSVPCAPKTRCRQFEATHVLLLSSTA